MDLIIVESPTKAKTISKFLPKDYQVESSFGHIRDLPKSELGIDLENNFQPKYVIPSKAKKTVSSLRSLAKKAEHIILASDEDREGEAIAWHLKEALKIDDNKTERIVFHEITKDAILEALNNPRQIDFDMVDAQQARRILDRLVGYKLSPFLWKKVAKGLSAGRVQSVAIRLIIEREREIKAFKSEEYWTIAAQVKTNDKQEFEANLIKENGKTLSKLELKEERAKKIEEALKKSEYRIDKVEKRASKKNPLPPFITSTLQQTANRYLGFSAKQTMTLAQKLYEKGYITYMRTDSYNLSSKFTAAAKDLIRQDYGEKYLSKKAAFNNKNKNAQEAHEAIRPTEITNSPDNQSLKVEGQEAKLYKLIWQRALASQMAPAEIDSTAIDCLASKDKDSYVLRANGQVIKFDGYLKVWPEKTKEQKLPEVKENDKLEMIKISSLKHETQPPARYSDAGLVKQLEKNSIGRPSTYAPTISTIITRNYVERDDNKRLKPTEIAFIVNDLLVAHFPNIVDFKFTAKMEEDLDSVANGKNKWQPLISEFWKPFEENLEKKYNEIKKEEIMPIEESNEICDKCGAKMIVKTGRYGKFLACSAFPDCKNIKGLDKKDGENKVDPKLKELQDKYQNEICDKCGAKMAVKNGKYGPFIACTAYPKCKNIKNISAHGVDPVTCPICNEGKIVKKVSRKGVFYACDAYPKCKNAYQGEPSGKTCEKCGGLLIFNDSGKERCSNKECKK